MSAAVYYVVFDPIRPMHNRFLGLDGPAAYPRWGLANSATPMTFARAHSFANAYGSTSSLVVGIERASDEGALMAEVQAAESRRVLASCG